MSEINSFNDCAKHLLDWAVKYKRKDVLIERIDMPEEK